MVEGEVFGLGLDVDGFQVPLMVKMERIEAPEQPQPSIEAQQLVDERQLSLFG